MAEKAGIEGISPELLEELEEKWEPERLSAWLKEQMGEGRALEATERAQYERMLGGDFSEVRVFRGGFASEMTKAHRAQALTVGGTGMILMSDLAARSPMFSRDQHALLAHELQHVTQAQRGMHAKAEFDFAAERSELEAEAEAAEDLALQQFSSVEESGRESDKKRIAERVQELLAEHYWNGLERDGV